MEGRASPPWLKPGVPARATDGTTFYGWQKNHLQSIEKTLQDALALLLQHSPTLQAASRTDKGVHAYGQVVNFITYNPLALEKILSRLNSLLPKSIIVRHIDQKPLSFHPTLDTQYKTYYYQLATQTILLPWDKPYSWHFPYALDLKIMTQAANELVSKQNFSSFSSKKYKNAQCDLTKLSIIDLDNGKIRIEIKANRFLYKMARNIAGLLTYIGAHKIPKSVIKETLQNPIAGRLNYCAPAHGLMLQEVHY